MSPSHETPTPPFVLWSLAVDCIYREEAEPSEPERVERILRPLRAAAEALAEGRSCNEVCVQAGWSPEMPVEQVTGFLLADTLLPFGGTTAAQQTCGPCPANVAMAPEQTPRWAGCHGLLIAHQPQQLQPDLQAAWSEAAARLELPEPTRPASHAWNRLWGDSPLSAEQLQWQAAVWHRFDAERAKLAGLAAYQRALATALAEQLVLHVRAYPPGIRSGRHWRLPAHCPRCSVVREENSSACSVCHTTQATEPARRRFAKGERPYWQLTRFLGAQATAEFLERYAIDRAAH